MAENHSLITVFQLEARIQRVAKVRRATYEQYEQDLAELRGRSLPERLALLPVDHFVWSDDLVRAFSHDIDFTIGREDARLFELEISWHPSLDDCDAVIEECLDLSSIRPSPTDESPIENDENEIEIRNGIWTINFGGSTVQLRHSKGLAYIKELLQRPREEVSIYDLNTLVDPPEVDSLENNQNEPEIDLDAESSMSIRDSGEAGPIVDLDAESGMRRRGLGDAGPITDGRSIREYRARLKKLNELIHEADEFGDTEKRERLKDEKDDLCRHVRASLNSSGRSRVSNSMHERLRTRIYQAITVARNRIEAKHRGLFEHLKKHIKTGSFCRYEPPEGVRLRIRPHKDE